MTKNPHNAHIDLTLTPDVASSNEMVDGVIIFNHSQRGGGRFILRAKITGRDDYEEELDTRTQDYSPHKPHQRIFNFKSPITPGVYEVVASVTSESGEELESSKAPLIVRAG